MDENFLRLFIAAKAVIHIFIALFVALWGVKQPFTATQKIITLCASIMGTILMGYFGFFLILYRPSEYGLAYLFLLAAACWLGCCFRIIFTQSVQKTAS